MDSFEGVVAQVTHFAGQLAARQNDGPTSTPTLSSTATSTTSSRATETTGNDDDGEAGSSPLLFFVALGFGVVFTNLW